MLYVISYCFTLPIFENTPLKNVVYVFYEPVEIMRVLSDTVWIVTEHGYLLFKGKCRAYERYYFATRRKDMVYDNGILALKETYKNSRLDGRAISFYLNGSIESVENYRNGLINGKSTRFYMNGKICSDRCCSNGKVVGPWIHYDKYGNIAMVINHSNTGEILNILTPKHDSENSTLSIDSDNKIDDNDELGGFF